MADDPVVQAKVALLIEMDDCLERAFAHQGKGSGRMVELLDALIAAVRAEAGSDHHAFAYALRCNVDDTTGEVTCPDGDIRPNADAAYGHYLLTRVTS
jgi:hypothetical protein